MTYLIISLLMYFILLSLDKLNGNDAFISDIDRMRRVMLCLIWPLTLLILYIVFKNKR